MTKSEMSNLKTALHSIKAKQPQFLNLRSNPADRLQRTHNQEIGRQFESFLKLADLNAREKKI